MRALMFLAASMAMIGAVGAQSADDMVKVSVDNVLRERSIIRAVVKVENLTAAKISMITVRCAFMNGRDEAVDTGVDMVLDLAPGAVKWAKPSAKLHGSMIQQRCYVDFIAP